MVKVTLFKSVHLIILGGAQGYNQEKITHWKF